MPRTLHCAHCGETRRTHSLWAGFALAPGADVVCCLPHYEVHPAATP